MTDRDSPRLIVVGGAEQMSPAEFQLGAQICTLGRAEDCQIVVRRADVSRLHARIEPTDEGYLISDAESANGTYINGRPLRRPQLLRHHDTIGLGEPSPLLRFFDPSPLGEQGAGLRYHSDRRSFSLGGQDLRLSPSETRLLLHLSEHRGELCGFDQCARAVWGEGYEPGRDSRLDSLLRDVRRKLRAIEPAAAERLKVRRGRGYILD
jgi:FHA domain/Transcriptional regulatory protein, C terminal